MKQEGFGSLANGKPNGGLECTPVLVPEFFLVSIHAIKDPKARFQLLDSQWLVVRTIGAGVGGLTSGFSVPAP